MGQALAVAREEEVLKIETLLVTPQSNEGKAGRMVICQQLVNSGQVRVQGSVVVER